VLYASHARSYCSRTTTTSTGRSTGTSLQRPFIRTEWRCAGERGPGVPVARRSRVTRVCARSTACRRRPSLIGSRAHGTPASASARTTRRSAAAARSNRRSRRRIADGPPAGGPSLSQKTGGVLLSQALASQVPSALRGLTALFGMGRGVSPSPKPPEKHERPRPHGPSKLHSATAGTTKKIRQALDPLVPVSFERHRPSRSGLSTWWSTRGLTPSRGWQSSS
jgi:hypothetical protein